MNLFLRGNAVRVVTAEGLAGAFLDLLANEQARRELGRRASEIFAANSGAREQTMAALDELLRDQAAAPEMGREAAPVASSRRV